MIKGVEISKEFLIKLLEVNRLIKADHILFENSPNGILAYGMKASMSGYASLSTIEFNTSPLNGLVLPFNFGLQSSLLSAEVKNITDEETKKEQCIFIGNYIDNFDISIPYSIEVTFINKTGTFTNVIPLTETFAMQIAKNHLLQDINPRNINYSMVLTGNAEFESIMALKADFGLTFMNIGKYPVSISHSIINCNKGDTVSVNIYNVSIGKVVEFVIQKPKKHCVLHTFVRIIAL